MGFFRYLVLVEENVYYFAYESSESGFLDGRSTYDYYLVKRFRYKGEYNIAYDELNCNCENRDGVFFNNKMLIYLISLSSLVGMGILFARVQIRLKIWMLIIRFKN